MSEWDTLLAIHRERADEYYADRANPPVACPIDGTPLEGGPGGVLHCPFDGWTYPTDPNPLHGEV